MQSLSHAVCKFINLKKIDKMSYINILETIICGVINYKIRV